MDFFHLFLLLVTLWVFGKIARQIKVPIVFGELLGGVLLGPSILGVIEPTETIGVLAEFGVFFLMLHSGLETDPDELTEHMSGSLLVGVFSFLCSGAFVYAVCRWFDVGQQHSVYTALTLSISSAAIAMRVLKDLKLHHLPLVHIVIGASIVCEILSLSMFSILEESVRMGAVSIETIAFPALKTILFFVVVLSIGHRYSHHLDRVLVRGNKSFTFTLIIALLFAWLAEALGLHMIIGAFLAGLYIRREVIDSDVFHKIEDRIFGLSYSFLGPIFFASLAFHLDFVAMYQALPLMVVLLVASIAGNTLGAKLSAFRSGMRKRHALTIGLALNNPGAAALVVTSIGFHNGLIDTALFSTLVALIMASTLCALALLRPLAPLARNIGEWDAVGRKV